MWMRAGLRGGGSASSGMSWGLVSEDEEEECWGISCCERMGDLAGAVWIFLPCCCMFDVDADVDVNFDVDVYVCDWLK